MKPFFKKLVSVFFLLAFTVSLAEKGLHDFSHRDDFHCAEKADKHIHSEVHFCSLCDFHLAAAQEPVAHDLAFISVAQPLVLNSDVRQFQPPRFFQLPVSRGPPATA